MIKVFAPETFDSVVVVPIHIVAIGGEDWLGPNRGGDGFHDISDDATRMDAASGQHMAAIDSRRIEVQSKIKTES